MLRQALEPTDPQRGQISGSGDTYSTLYELINRGEIARVMIGSRSYVSREQLNEFISANTHTGYHAR